VARPGLRDAVLPADSTAVLLRGARLAGHAAEVESLFDRTGAPLAARWPSLDTWLRHHPRSEPWVVLVRRGAVPVGGAVLVRELRFGCWRVRPAGAEGEPVHLAATDPAAAATLAAAVRRALGGFDRPWLLRLTDLPDPDPVAAALAAALPVSVRCPGQGTPQLRFAAGLPLTAYLSRNTRAAVAKARNRIVRDGLRADIGWATTLDQIAAALPEITDVHRRRSVQVRGKSTFEQDPAAARLFEAVVRLHASAGRVRLLSVRVDGSLAAFALCLLDGDMLWVYANLASPDWLRYSAGTIANAEVVRWAYAAPETAGVDWGTGIQRYKLSGAVTVRRSQHLYAWSSRLLRLGAATHRRLTMAARPPADPPG
jgi:CelD/BcsL family acetyltransferase involved in cellulose biosynthesis